VGGAAPENPLNLLREGPGPDYAASRVEADFGHHAQDGPGSRVGPGTADEVRGGQRVEVGEVENTNSDWTADIAELAVGYRY